MTVGIVLPKRHAVVLCCTWVAILLLAGLDVFWLAHAGIHLNSQVYYFVFPTLFLLTAVAFFYRYVRRDDALWLAAEVVSQLILGSYALATFSYLGLLPDYPLRDAFFTGMDEWLGFDWRGYVGWVNAHSLVAKIYTFCYRMTGPEVIFLLVVLGFSKQFTSLHRLATGFLLGALITVTIAIFWPAQCAYLYHGIPATSYPNLAITDAVLYKDDFFAMRNHALSVLPAQFQGIVSFPSFHSAIAVLALCAAAAIPWRLLRLMVIMVNGVILLSTPVDGGHYFVDTLSGILLGLFAAACAAKWLPREAV